jgi:hypothetical protein
MSFSKIFLISSFVRDVTSTVISNGRKIIQQLQLLKNHEQNRACREQHAKNQSPKFFDSAAFCLIFFDQTRKTHNTNNQSDK